MGIESSKRKLDRVSAQDSNDEDLVALNSLDAHELHDHAATKDFEPRKLPHFSMSIPDDIGKVLEGQGIVDQKGASTRHDGHIKPQKPRVYDNGIHQQVALQPPHHPTDPCSPAPRDDASGNAQGSQKIPVD